ncbi:MAG: hypothetical protein RL088_2144 [Verrucomicrobiota bacterium]
MKTIRVRSLLQLMLALCLILAQTARCEIAPVPPKELASRSTHVVTGKILGVYAKTVKDGDYLRTEYVAEVRVLETEKGNGVKVGSLIYVRYWTQDWRGLGIMPPGTRGYWDIPKEGEKLRIHLVQKSTKIAERFAGDSADGGFDVLAPNGFFREP